MIETNEISRRIQKNSEVDPSSLFRGLGVVINASPGASAHAEQ